MSNLEEARFEIRNNEFNKAVAEYRVNDDAAWSLIESRQFEIADSIVSNQKKAQAFDGVLAAISGIFPQNDTAYCKALAQRLAYTDKKNVADMERIAKDAYFHRRNADFMLYGKIIHEVYKHSKDKDNFPYKDIAKYFRKKEREQQKDIEREDVEKQLSELDFYLEDPQTDPVKKLSLIDEIIDLTKDKYFGPVKANTYKKNYCKLAVTICREELFDEDTANFYLGKAKEFDRRSEKASIEWERRRNMPTKAKEKAYMYKYRSDNNR